MNVLEDVKNQFRESMGRLAAGVSIVTTDVGNRPWGLTISACASISMDPPLLMISLANNTASTDAILKNKRFAVSILNNEQIDIAKQGSQQGKPKFFEKFVTKSNNKYLINNALANIQCNVENIVPAGDHTIFIGRVEHVDLGDLKDPLLYYHRNFGSFKKDVTSLKSY